MRLPVQIVLILLLISNGCTVNPLNSMIESFSEDGIIDDNELVQINEFVQGDRRLSKTLKSEKEILDKVKSIIERNGLDVKVGKVEELPITNLNYNIYLENSGSMFGYIKGSTQFEEALMGLWTKINVLNDTINIFFVNDEVYPVEQEFTDFFGYLEPQNVRNFGQTKSSKIADIIKLAVLETKKKEEPVILFSDFIFSLEQGGKIQDQLAVQKFGITNIIHNYNLPEEDYGFLIVKLTSNFDGKYYDFENRPIVLDNEVRPYYIWIIDKAERLKKFDSKYQINELAGYEAHTLIYKTAQNAPYYSILSNTNKKGKFGKTNRAEKSIKKIKKIDFHTRNQKIFQMAVAADLSAVPVSASYLSNISNYVIEQNGTNFKINSIEVLRDVVIPQKDQDEVGSATHIITLEASEIKAGKSSIAIALNKELPEWVMRSSVINDKAKDARAGKTFGFKYLIEGVRDAFKNKSVKDEKYFTLPLKLER